MVISIIAAKREREKKIYKKKNYHWIFSLEEREQERGSLSVSFSM
jgi:hypothetical protein